MRQTHPLNADEARVDAACRQTARSHAEVDAALMNYRLALMRAAERSALLERSASLILGEVTA